MNRTNEEARLTRCKELKQPIELPILPKARLVTHWKLEEVWRKNGISTTKVREAL